jgi:hypothetical protein
MGGFTGPRQVLNGQISSLGTQAELFNAAIDSIGTITQSGFELFKVSGTIKGTSRV